jgi:hypothetical protein
MSKKYTIQDGQSIYDASTQLYGGLDSIVQLAKDSGIDNLNASLNSGQIITYEVTNEVVSNQFSIDGTIVSTSKPLVVGLGDYNEDYNQDYNI